MRVFYAVESRKKHVKHTMKSTTRAVGHTQLLFMQLGDM